MIVRLAQGKLVDTFLPDYLRGFAGSRLSVCSKSSGGEGEGFYFRQRTQTAFWPSKPPFSSSIGTNVRFLVI
jgi:hypothetical protein